MYNILIFEDEIDHFFKICEILKDNDFSYYPDSEENFYKTIKDLQTLLSTDDNDSTNNTSHLKKYIFSLIDEHKPHAIICDLSLSKDPIINPNYSSHGQLIIDLIRSRVNESEISISEYTPIIAFSQHSQLLSYCAAKGTEFMFKFFIGDDITPEDYASGSLLFVAKLRYLIEDFCKNINIVRILKPTFDLYAEQLREHDKAIFEKFGNVELLLKGNHNELISYLDLIFNAIYIHLKNPEKEKFKQKFTDDIRGKISSKRLSIIEENDKVFWERFKEAFSNMNQANGFEKFVITLIDLLKEQNLLDILPGGVLAGIALKGIVGILASGSKASRS